MTIFRKTPRCSWNWSSKMLWRTVPGYMFLWQPCRDPTYRSRYNISSFVTSLPDTTLHSRVDILTWNLPDLDIKYLFEDFLQLSRLPLNNYCLEVCKVMFYQFLWCRTKLLHWFMTYTNIILFIELKILKIEALLKFKTACYFLQLKICHYLHTFVTWLLEKKSN